MGGSALTSRIRHGSAMAPSDNRDHGVLVGRRMRTSRAVSKHRLGERSASTATGDSPLCVGACSRGLLGLGG